MITTHRGNVIESNITAVRIVYHTDQFHMDYLSRQRDGCLGTLSFLHYFCDSSSIFMQRKYFLHYKQRREE